MKRSLAVVVSCLVAASCTDRGAMTSPRGEVPRAEVVDGGSGGNPLFYFLAPLTTQASYAPSDPTLLPFLTVVICPGQTSTCSQPTTLKAPALKLDGGRYLVFWPTPKVTSPIMDRIAVFLGTRELGHIDVEIDPVGGAPGASPSIIGGQSLKIAFAALSGVGCAGLVDCVELLIAPDTDNVVVTPEQKALLVLPAGSAAIPLLVQIYRVSDGGDDTCIPFSVHQPFACYHYETIPYVPQFSKLLTLSMCADGATNLEELELFKWNPITGIVALPVVPPSQVPQLLDCTVSTGLRPGGSGLFGRLAGAWERWGAPVARVLGPTPLQAATLGGPTVSGSSLDLSNVTPIRLFMSNITALQKSVGVGGSVIEAVRVVGQDANGRFVPVSGVPVTFSASGGTLARGNQTGSVIVAPSESSGGVGVQWTLPTVPGTYYLTVTVAGGEAVVFTAVVS